jgi:predicted permease
MHSLLADIRYAIRSLRFAPGFFTLAIGILALGIGASVSVFTIVDGVLLRPLPYRHPNQLVALTSIPADPKFDSNGSTGYADFEQFRSHCVSFSDVAVTYRQGWSAVRLTGEAEPENAQAAFVSSNFFALFGISPILGRTFTEEENRRGDRLAVLSEGLATRRFASAAQALGHDIELSGTKWRVIGVMPADFRVPFLNTQLWAPVMSHPEWNDPEESDSRFRPRWDIIARLKPRATRVAAQADVDSVEKRLKSELPEYHQDNVRVVPLSEHFTGSVRRPLLILLASVAFLLIIACTNVGNLLLARAAVRRREFAVRAALGAGRFQLFRQVLAENAFVALLGGTAGVVVAVFLVPILKAIAPAGTPRLLEVEIDARVLAFAAAVTCGSALLLGLAPGWNASRRGLADVLNAAGRAATGSRRTTRTKSFLVVGEFAMAMVLLTGAALLLRSFVAVLGVDLGFRPEHVLTISVSLPNSTPPPQTARFYADVLASITALPGVESAGGVGNLFFLDEKRTHALRQVEGRPPEPRSAWKPLVWTQVNGHYFRAMAAFSMIATGRTRRPWQSSMRLSHAATGSAKIRSESA